MTIRRRLLAAAITTSACALAGEGDDRSEAIRTDSAGVEIVVNSMPAAGAPVFAALDSVPSLRLGSLEGGPQEQFATVTDVEALPDGGVAVLDAQAAEVRLFRADGTHRITLGSKGRGPGEHQRPIEVALVSGDTLAVYDAGLRRITRFGPDGALGRVTSLEETRSQIVAASFLADGRMVAQSRWLAPGVATVPGSEPALVRDTAVLVLFGVGGEVQDTVDVVPGSEAVVKIEVGESSVEVLKRPAAFGRTNVFAVHPDGIWSSANDRFELRLRDPEGGRLLRIARAPGLERTVTDDVARTLHDHALLDAETAEARSRIELWYSLSPRPEPMPAFDLFAVDDRRRLWVRAWSPSFEAGTRWWVFGAGGELLGAVETPGRLRITSVRCDGVLGIEQDDLGLSYVVRYPLRHVTTGPEGPGSPGAPRSDPPCPDQGR